MTTFQDQPPQSRRAARESERAAQASGTGVGYNAFLEPTESDAVREKAETARPASAGRRAQRPEGEAGADLPVAAVPTTPAPEPLSYATQIPSYDGPSFARTVPRPPADPDQPYRVRDYSPEGGRRRASLPQFSPSSTAAELDYQTAATPSAWQPPTVEATPPATSTPAPTAQPMTRREMRALLAQQEAAEAAALVEPTATTTTSALSTAIAEFEALTRATHAAPPVPPVSAAPVDDVAPEPVAEAPSIEAERVDESPVVPVPLIEPTTAAEFFANASAAAESPAADVPTADAPTADAPTADEPTADAQTADAQTTNAQTDEGVDDDDPILVTGQIVDAAEPAPFPFALQPSRTQDSMLLAEPEPIAAVPETTTEPERESESSIEPEAEHDGVVVDEPAVEPELFVEPRPVAVESVPVTVEPVDDAEPVAAAEPEFIEPPVVRESYTPPTGHWSRQADLDDDLPFESTLTREVGGSNLSTTTSALILPSIPQSDFSGILNGTGEILITGTIELPESLGTMGGDSRNFDHPDVDHMFDAFDKELVSNDSQPVRAIRAVSTHTATRSMIQANTKTHSNRLLTVAIVAVSVVVVGVVGLLAVYILSTMNS